MNSLADEILFGLLRASVVLMITMLLVRWLSVKAQLQSPVLHRFLCVVVLLQGCLFVPITFSIPWYEPSPKDVVVVTPPVLNHLTKGQLDGQSNLAWLNQQDLKFSSLSGEFGTSDIEHGASRQTVGFDSIGKLLVVAWIAGIIIIAARMLVGYIAFVLMLPRAGDVEKEWLVEWRSLLHSHGVSREIPLRVTDQAGPMLCLLPGGYELLVPKRFWQETGRGGRKAILRHELMHYKRRDVWKSWIVRLIALPHWFNPAAWWAVRTFEEASEWSCDHAAASSSADRIDYLQALQRLVEMQIPRKTLAGRCAHSHPLVLRVRRLLQTPTSGDSIVRKTIVCAIAALLVAVNVFRVELVAFEPSGVNATVEQVKKQVESLEGQLKQLEEDSKSLVSEVKSLGQTIDQKIGELKKLGEDLAQLTADARRRVELFQTGDKEKQLEALKDVASLGDEAVLLCGLAAKKSSHESVRTKALETIASMGSQGYPAMALCFENLTEKERVYFVEQLAKRENEDHLLAFAAIGQKADGELLKALLKIGAKSNKPAIFLASIAKEANEEFLNELLGYADSLNEDDSLLLLYAAAKRGGAEGKVKAVKLAAARQDRGYPVIAAAFQSKNAEARAEVVRQAKKIGGEVGDFVIEKALNDEDESLRAVAQEALKEKK